MLEPSQIADPAQPTQQPTTPNGPPLHPTIAGVRAALQRTCDADDVAVSKLHSRRVALAHVDVFFQVLVQVPVMASGTDFVAGASWLSGYYRQVAEATSEAARGASVLRPDGTPLGGGMAEQHQRMLGDLEAKAAMWDEVVEAAGEVDNLDVILSPIGTLRIWTVVAAAAIAQAPKQRHPAEARAVYDMASTLSSEAAAMAAGLLGG